MAREETYYSDQAGHSGVMMAAEPLAWIGSHWASGLESRTFKKLGMWRGSASATNAAYSSLRSSGSLASRYMGNTVKPGIYRSMAGGTRSAATVAPKLMSSAKYGSALNLMQRRGGGAFSPAAWRAAGRRGVFSQFAKLAASSVGKAVLTGLEIGFWGGMAYQGVMGAVTTMRSVGRSVPRQEFGQKFFDTEGTYTERQRAIRAITSSRLSTRSAIGGEAQLMHR